MLSYDDGKFGISLGTNKWSGLHSQQTGLIGIRSSDFSFSYENDGAPFGNTLGDNNDSHRTAAIRIGVGAFQAGFNLFTGERDESSYAEKGGSDLENMTTYSANRTYGISGFFKNYLAQFQ